MLRFSRMGALSSRATHRSLFAHSSKPLRRPHAHFPPHPPHRHLHSSPRLLLSRSLLVSAPLAVLLRPTHPQTAHSHSSSVSPQLVQQQEMEENKEEASSSPLGRIKEFVVKMWNKLCRLFMASKRIAVCTTVLSSALMLTPPALFLNYKEELWSYYLNCIQYLGPTFIKLAQWASTRPDLFPEDFTRHLEKMQDSTMTYPWELAQNTLNASFGEAWNEKLVLETEPIGAGCIAQVYKGKLLNDDGESQNVAVKLIHPHVRKQIEVDMYILRKLADLFELVPSFEYLSTSDIVDQFAFNMGRQIDLRKEAKHLLRFAENFRDRPHIKFPRPIPGYIEENVLVETFEDGRSINEYMKGNVSKSMKKKLVKLCSQSLLEMVFKHNFVHGDLHPGNILVQESAGKDPKIVFIDCGIVTQVQRHQYDPMLDICNALLHYNGYEAGMLLADHSSKFDKKNLEAFCQGVESVVSRAKHLNYFEHLGGYIMDVCSLSCKYRVKVVPEYFNVAMAIKVAEGIALSLDPTIEMATEAIPIIMKIQAQNKFNSTLGRKSTFSFEE